MGKIKKFTVVVSFGVLSFVLLSCGNQKPPQSSASADASQTEGGSVTGGSNSIAGQPIEGYIADTQYLPEYRSVLKSILERMNYLSPSFSLKLKNSLSITRTWYIVPGQLAKISNHEIAVPLNQSTDQFALHYAKSVWISESARNQLLATKKGLQASAKHLLHEMVMSVRVDENLRNNKSFLSTADYEDIRAVTDYIFSQSYSAYELEKFLAFHNFSDQAADMDSVYDSLNIPKDLIINNVDFSTSENLYKFLASRPNKDLPQLQYGEMAKVLGHCTYKFEPTTKTIKVATNGKMPLSMEIKLDSKIKSRKVSDKMYLQSSQAVNSRSPLKKNVFVTIQSNQITRITFFLNHSDPLKQDQDWRYKDQTINCLQSVNYMKEKTRFVDYLKSLLG